MYVKEKERAGEDGGVRSEGVLGGGAATTNGGSKNCRNKGRM